MEWRRVARALNEPAMLVLAVVAILFAVIQFFDSRHQLRTMTEVSNSMSTSYVGEFPKNMNDITKLIASAAATVDIMVDFPGYGHYSNPDRFKTYLRTIEDAATKARVRLLVYSEKAAHDTRQRQFRPSDFASKKASDLFKTFFMVVNPTLGVPNTYDEFDEKLSSMQKLYEQDLVRHGVNVRHISERLQFYLWLEDSDDAVFSFQNSVREEHEISFRTRDGKLIDTFRDTFEDLWTRADTSLRLPPH